MCSWGFPGGLAVKNLPQHRSRGFDPWVRTILAEGMATHSSTLAWRIPWTESLAAYSPWGRKEWDTAKVTEHACTHTYVFICTCLCIYVSFYVFILYTHSFFF